MPSKKTKLTPPDPKRCQANVFTGCHPAGTHMMNLGPGKVERCSKKPTVIVKEKKPAEDGQRGSMSLCAGCLKEFQRRFPKGYATVTKIK